MTNELDKFIKEQKEKLSHDLQEHRTQKSTTPKDRKQWKKDSASSNIAEQDPERKQWRKDVENSKLAEERPKTPGEVGLPVGSFSEQKKRRLKEERQREYNEFLEKTGSTRTLNNTTSPEKPESPHNDPDMTQISHVSPRRRQPKSPSQDYDGYFPSPTRTDLEQQLNEQRKKEYNELLKQKGYRGNNNTNRRPPSRDSQSGFLSKFGSYERDRKKLGEIRKNEYNAMLAEKNKSPRRLQNNNTIDYSQQQWTPGRQPVPRGTGDQDELFKEFLDTKYGNKGTQSPVTRPPPKQVHNEPKLSSIPGLGGRESAENGYVQNGYVNGVAETEGRRITTPSYEEILDKKRKEENRYRRHDDPGYSRPNNMSMAYGRDNAEAERKLDDLDREYESRRTRFDSERAMNNGGGEWQLSQPIAMDFLNSPVINNYSQYPVNQQNGHAPAYNNTPQKQPPPQSQRYAPPSQPPRGQYRASLPIGQDDRQNEKRRKQEQYRLELEQQINQKQGNNRRGRKDANNNRPPPQQQQPQLPNQQLSPRQDRQAPVTNGYGGWNGAYEPSHLSHPPQDLNYQPSPYLSNEAFNSIDEAYRYYGTKNPLDVDDYGPPPNIQQAPRSAPQEPTRVSFQQSPPNRYQMKTSPPERSGAYDFRSDDRNDRRGKPGAQEYQRELQQQIMDKQMQNRRKKEEQQRYEQKLEDDIRNYNPFGRGGGGAPLRDEHGNTIGNLKSMQSDQGDQSPPKTQRSRTPVSQRDTRPAIDDPSLLPPKQTTTEGDPTYARGGHGIFGNPKTENEKKSSDKYKDELRLQIEEKRRQAEEEKEKLRKEEERENERLRLEQEKMKSDYEKEQKKAKEKEDEVRKRNEELRKNAEDKKREQEEARKKQDEIRQQALRDQEEKNRKEREKEVRSTSPPIPAVKTKQAIEGESEPMERRGSSPPLPTHKRHSSPPVPATKRTSVISQDVRPESRPNTRQKTPISASGQQSRAGSANILNQLAVMKKQLQTERNRVENDLVQEQDDYEVYDARLSQKPQKREAEIDIFEGARHKAPVSVRMPGRATKEFTDLKNNDETVSRRSFRAKYPNDPHSHDALEIQQNAMIERQEKKLKTLKKQSVYEKALPRMNPKDLRMVRDRSMSPQSMLQSETAFIDMNGMNTFPDDFEDLPRDESVAEPRRKRKPTTKPVTPARRTSDSISMTSNMTGHGSTMSLNVDRLTKKNEDRLKRLQDLSAGDDMSVADADDVIDRFMAKQVHHRPSSGQTLLDDTWMQAGSSSHQP